MKSVRPRQQPAAGGAGGGGRAGGGGGGGCIVVGTGAWRERALSWCPRAEGAEAAATFIGLLQGLYYKLLWR